MKGKVETDLGKNGRINTMIGRGAIINGDLKIQNSLRIDGQVKGDIQVTETMILGKEGAITGSIHAGDVVIGGKVHGNIVASGKVLLESKSVVCGDIQATQLVVDEGAIFDGQCKMSKKDQHSAEKKTATHSS